MSGSFSGNGGYVQSRYGLLPLGRFDIGSALHGFSQFLQRFVNGVEVVPNYEEGSRGRFAQEYRSTAFGGPQLSGIADRLNPGLGPFGCCAHEGLERLVKLFRILDRIEVELRQ